MEEAVTERVRPEGLGVIKILQFCGVNKQLLTIDELREVLSVEPGQKSVDRVRL